MEEIKKVMIQIIKEIKKKKLVNKQEDGIIKIEYDGYYNCWFSTYNGYVLGYFSIRCLTYEETKKETLKELKILLKKFKQENG